MCSPKTMIKIGVALAVPLAVGFIAFPQFRVTILAVAPFALYAICPLSMIYCMKGMKGGNKSGKSCPSGEHTPAEKTKHGQVKN